VRVWTPEELRYVRKHGVDPLDASQSEETSSVPRRRFKAPNPSVTALSLGMENVGLISPTRDTNPEEESMTGIMMMEPAEPRKKPGNCRPM
jgi:hypothetical protein